MSTGFTSFFKIYFGGWVRPLADPPNLNTKDATGYDNVETTPGNAWFMPNGDTSLTIGRIVFNSENRYLDAWTFNLIGHLPSAICNSGKAAQSHPILPADSKLWTLDFGFWILDFGLRPACEIKCGSPYIGRRFR
jgi:hypothetical protein